MRHYTRDAAYASFDESRKGTIAVGKYADFVVLSGDILVMAPAELLETRVLLTVMGGRETYRASGFGASSAGRRAAWTPRASPHGWVHGVPADEAPNPEALKL